MRAAVPLVLLLAGCAAVNDPERHLPERVAADQLCIEYARILCDAATDCCDAITFTDPQRQGCVEATAQACNVSFSPTTNDPRAGYGPREAGRQIAIADGYLNACSPELFDWFSRPDGLPGISTGTVDPGGACDPLAGESATDPTSPRFLSCRGDGVCAQTPDGWRCTAEPLAAGASCTPGTRVCADGLACVEGTCEPRGAVGAPCFLGSDCQSGACTGISIDEGVAGGRCRPTEDRFCELFTACPSSNVAYQGEAGPIVEGASCPHLVACVESESPEGMTLVGSLLGAGWQCGASDLVRGCDGEVCLADVDGVGPVEGPGVLTADGADSLCGFASNELVLLLICTEFDYSDTLPMM